MTRHRWIYAATVLAVLAAGAGAAVALTRPSVVTLSKQACGDGWSGPSSDDFTVRDAADSPVQLYVIDPARNLVYAEARDISPGSRREVATSLGTGRYALRCVFGDGTVRTSRAYTVTNGRGATGLAPMPDLDLTAPVQAYRRYVQANLPGLLRDARTLATDVQRGDLGAARRDWLPAHLDYERLGAAYTSFQDFDGALDGTDDGLPGGVGDKDWTGFFRLEYGLWHRQSAAELKPIAAQLVDDVHGLITDFPSEEIDPADLPLRSHEILENALQFQLTGRDDYGSGTTLATVYANTQGTRAVLGTLRSLVGARDPGMLTAIDGGLGTVQGDLRAARTPGGGWTPVTALPQRQRQKLDGDLGALLEQLALMPNLLQERTSA